MPSRMRSRHHRVPVHPVHKWFPGRGSAFVAPSVRIFYTTKIRANLLWWKQEKAPRQVLSCLKNGVRLSFHRPPPPLHASISIACAEQGCRIRHTGPVQRGQFGRLRPVAASGLQLSLQSTRSHASERKAAHDTKLSLPKFFLQKAALSIRAGQGSSQASTTPRLVGCLVSMSAQRTGMSRYTQLQRTTSAFIWRSRRHTWMLPAAPSRFLFSRELTGRCPTAQWANIRWWKERAQHCRSDTPTHPLFGPRSSRSWLKQ